MAAFVITIDGPAASGKSTAAKLLAQKLDADYLDTGAMYRAVTLAAMQSGIDIKNEEKLRNLIDKTKIEFDVREGKSAVFVNGTEVTTHIRKPEVTANVRYIASVPQLRRKLVEMQRKFADEHEKIVTEGRDQGTVAFPDANVKFFLTADENERARRRQSQPILEGGGGSFKEIRKAIRQRDNTDENRPAGPLKPADDAVIIDTTSLNIEQVVDRLLSFVKRII